MGSEGVCGEREGGIKETNRWRWREVRRLWRERRRLRCKDKFIKTVSDKTIETARNNW